MNPLLDFCMIARPIMLRYMSPNSCIAATKVTCECLERLGLSVKPVPVKLAVTIPDANLAYCSGLTSAELSTAAGSEQYRPYGKGWNGHLIALADDFLLDASLDQVSLPLRGHAPLPHEVFVFPLPYERPEAFHAIYVARLDNGTSAKIEYAMTDDNGYVQTDAWNDENLSQIVDVIIGEIVRKYALSKSR